MTDRVTCPNAIPETGHRTERHVRTLVLILLWTLPSACAAGGSGMSRQTRGQAVPLGGLATLGAIRLASDASVEENRVPASPADVWVALSPAFETLQIEPAAVDATAMMMGNPDFTPRLIEGRRLSRYLDCGGGPAGPNADQYLVTLQWMVWLDATPEGGTLVTTSLDAYARPRDVAGNAVHCVSRGALERRLAELITEGT